MSLPLPGSVGAAFAPSMLCRPGSGFWLVFCFTLHHTIVKSRRSGLLNIVGSACR